MEKDTSTCLAAVPQTVEKEAEINDYIPQEL